MVTKRDNDKKYERRKGRGKGDNSEIFNFLLLFSATRIIYRGQKVNISLNQGKR